MPTASPATTVFFVQAEDGIRVPLVTGVQTCALPICRDLERERLRGRNRARLEHGRDFREPREDERHLRVAEPRRALGERNALLAERLEGRAIARRSEERRVGKEGLRRQRAGGLAPEW